MGNTTGTAFGYSAAILLVFGLIIFLVAFIPRYLRWRAEQRATGTNARIPPNLTGFLSTWFRSIRSHGRTKVSDPEPAMELRELSDPRPLPKIYPDRDGKFRLKTNHQQVSGTRPSPRSVYTIREEDEAHAQYPSRRTTVYQPRDATTARKPLPEAPPASPYLTKALPALQGRPGNLRLTTRKLPRALSGSKFTEDISPVSPMSDIDLSGK